MKSAADFIERLRNDETFSNEIKEKVDPCKFGCFYPVL